MSGTKGEVARPNILFIMTDQMRADALGCFGGSPAHTPNLDAIARGGMRFTRCATNSPICAPARASLLAGLYPHQLGVWDNSPHTFPRELGNWVRDLRDSGYRTSVIGKTHYYPYNGSVPDMRDAEPYLHALGYQDVDEIPGPRVSGTLLSHMTAGWKDRGYMEKVRQDLASRYAGNHAIARESVLPLDLYPDVYVGRQAVDYLGACDRSEPFFCCVSFGGPHDPWDCPREYSARFDDAPVPAPLPEFRDRNPSRARGSWDKAPEHPPFGPGNVAAIRRNYAGKVSLIDDQIGRILAVLERRGLRGNTVVAFASDHGEMNGDQGRLYKSNFLESAIRVPLLIDVPGRCADGGGPRGECGGAVSDALVELADLGPTFLDAAGLAPSYPQEGRSLLPLVGARTPDAMQIPPRHRDFVVSEYDREMMISDGRRKLAVNRDGVPYLLFDLVDDPHEQDNLVDDPRHAAPQAAMLGMLEDFRRATVAAASP